MSALNSLTSSSSGSKSKDRKDKERDSPQHSTALSSSTGVHKAVPSPPAQSSTLPSRHSPQGEQVREAGGDPCVRSSICLCACMLRFTDSQCAFTRGLPRPIHSNLPHSLCPTQATATGVDAGKHKARFSTDLSVKIEDGAAEEVRFLGCALCCAARSSNEQALSLHKLNLASHTRSHSHARAAMRPLPPLPPLSAHCPLHMEPSAPDQVSGACCTGEQTARLKIKCKM